MVRFGIGVLTGIVLLALWQNPDVIGDKIGRLTASFTHATSAAPASAPQASKPADFISP